MKEIKIEKNKNQNNKNNENFQIKINDLIFFNNNCLYYLKTIFSILSITIIIIIKIYMSTNQMIALSKFKKYINDCKTSIKYNQTKIKTEIPYLSICISALNMEKYIESNLLSIINQSFQNFEIIIINDFSIDNTENIIKRIQLEDDRIKIINHSKNLGVYYSRIESINNAKGNYINLMDPDDMFLNENLFQNLYNYNLNNKFDIIEYSVYQQIEGKKRIFSPNKHFENHFHNFPNKIIA